MADALSGVRIFLNSGDITKARQEFDKLMSDLQKQANGKPIDFQVNEAKFKDDIKKTVTTIDEALKYAKKLGEVTISPKFDKDGDLSKFNLAIKDSTGYISKLQYEIDKAIPKDSGALPRFNLIGITEIDKTKQQLQELQKVEQELIKSEQQLAEQMASGREKAFDDRIKSTETLRNEQEKLEQSNKKLEDQIMKNEGSSIIKNINDQTKAYSDLIKMLDSLEKQAQSVRFLPNSKQSDIKSIRSSINENLSSLTKGYLPDENNIKQITSEIIKLDRAIENMNNKDVAEGNRRNKFYDDYISKQKELNKLTLDSIKTKDPNSNEEIVRQERINKLTQDLITMKNSDSGYYKKVVASDSDFKELQELFRYQKQLTEAKVQDVEVTKQQNILSQENKRIQSLGEKLNQTPLDKNIIENDRALKQYVQSLYLGKNAFIDYSKGVDSAGKTKRIFNVEVEDGKNKIRQEKLVVDETTQSIYQQGVALKETANNTNGMKNGIMNIMGQLTGFAGAMGIAYKAIEEFKKSVSFVNDINKMQTNIMMIASDEVNKYKGGINGLTDSFSDLAKETGSTLKDLMGGSEEILRSGRNIEETQTLLKDTVIASKISGQDAKETSEQLC